MRVEERLTAIGITLPSPPTPAASYVPALTSAGMLYTAGQVPIVGGRLMREGKVGAAAGMVSAEEAQHLGRLCAVNALAAAKWAVGDLQTIRRVIKVVGFVASDPGFSAQSAVVDGASQLLAEAFGEAGIHVRSALPRSP